MGDVIDLLDRPVYRYAEADRLLRVNRGTVQRWVDGYTRNGVDYPPVVREARTGSPWVTWGEFVEARLLSEFRPQIPMIKMRPMVERLREMLDTRYPLSYARPFLTEEGRELLLAAQAYTSTDPGLWLVVSTGQGAIMTAASRRFRTATRFPDNIGPATAIYADSGTPEILLDPQRRQGQPTLNGISTSVLSELVGAGEPVAFVADTYGFTASEVEQAVSFEASRRAA